MGAFVRLVFVPRSCFGGVLVSTSVSLRARPFVAPLLLSLTVGACRAPQPAPLDHESLALAVTSRDASTDELRSALELAGLQPLAIEQPSADALRDPSRAEFWHACAWAWSPATRAARRRWEAARARAGSAGMPGPIRGAAEVRDLGDPGANTRVMFTFDLIGILGLGPAASARVLADAESREALSGLEEAMWAARFDVDRARVRLATARGVEARLDALAEDAGDALVRIEVLERNGRLSAGALARARIALQRLDDRRAAAASEVARAREDLATAAGLAPDAAALAAPGVDTLAAWPADADADADAVPTEAELLERVPRLRGLLLDYAIAEARLRDVAAQRWPDLGLGPHLFWGDPDFLVGAVAAAGIPWPGSLDGEIEAARVEREAARERVEDELLAVRTAHAAAREREVAARERLERGARPAAEESARLLVATRARFAVDAGALESWSHAVTEHVRSVQMLEEARAELALARLDVARNAGPAPEAPRLVGSPLAEVTR